MLCLHVGNSLDFEVNNKMMFEIPLGNVSHSTKGKNEVALEFHQNDDAAVSLMELRFHIPGDKDVEVDSVEVRGCLQTNYACLITMSWDRQQFG